METDTRQQRNGQEAVTMTRTSIEQARKADKSLVRGVEAPIPADFDGKDTEMYSTLSNNRLVLTFA